MMRAFEVFAILAFALYMLICAYGEVRSVNGPASHIEIDEETGCEYMVTAKGGITPRIGTDYLQVGCRWTDEEGEVVTP